MKSKEILETTDNSYIYNCARKFYLESIGKIGCSWCPYHKKENLKRHTYGRPQSWKKHRKTQYKGVK